MSWHSSWLSFFCKGLFGLFLWGCKRPNSPPAPIFIVDTVRSEVDLVRLGESRRKAYLTYAAPRVARLLVRSRYRYREETTMGTAWYLQGANVWVTCRHLFPVDKPAVLETELWEATGQCFAPLGVWLDSVVDVAFLRAPGQEGFALSDSVPEAGDWCFTYGAPWGLLGTFQEGYVVHPYRLVEGQVYLQLALWSSPGGSGSPVLTRHGEVAGMIAHLVSQSGTYEGITFAVPAQDIQQALARYHTFAQYDSTRAH